MTTLYKQLLTDCLVALGDSSGTVWSRTDKIIPWVTEAIKAFPLLRPMYKDHTLVLGDEHGFDLEVDFREMISIEYGGQSLTSSNPRYLYRKNRLDPEFYNEPGYYDVDHNFADGAGWHLYTSELLRIGGHIYIQYLANHLWDLDDDADDLITIPDEFETILISSVICRAYRERLSYYMQDPTAHMTVITQMTTMVQRAEENYRLQVAQAQAGLAKGKIGIHVDFDKYNRVY